MSIIPRGKIQVVDDDEDVRASTRLLLEAMGFSVEDFADAESFLKAAEGSPADCLILDNHLPGMSGVELLELLRQRGIDTPALIMTANGRQTAIRAAKAGATTVLRKPLAGDSLSHWLDQIFSGKN